LVAADFHKPIGACPLIQALADRREQIDAHVPKSRRHFMLSSPSVKIVRSTGALSLPFLVLRFRGSRARLKRGRRGSTFLLAAVSALQIPLSDGDRVVGISRQEMSSARELAPSWRHTALDQNCRCGSSESGNRGGPRCQGTDASGSGIGKRADITAVKGTLVCHTNRSAGGGNSTLVQAAAIP
jgi:hypothetical protein